MVIDNEKDEEFLYWLKSRLFDGNRGVIAGDERRDLANRLDVLLSRSQKGIYNEHQSQ